MLRICPKSTPAQVLEDGGLEIAWGGRKHLPLKAPQQFQEPHSHFIKPIASISINPSLPPLAPQHMRLPNKCAVLTPPPKKKKPCLSWGGGDSQDDILEKTQSWGLGGGDYQREQKLSSSSQKQAQPQLGGSNLPRPQHPNNPSNTWPAGIRRRARPGSPPSSL